MPSRTKWISWSEVSKATAQSFDPRFFSWMARPGAVALDLVVGEEPGEIGVAGQDVLGVGKRLAGIVVAGAMVDDLQAGYFFISSTKPLSRSLSDWAPASAVM